MFSLVQARRTTILDPYRSIEVLTSANLLLTYTLGDVGGGASSVSNAAVELSDDEVYLRCMLPLALYQQ